MSDDENISQSNSENNALEQDGKNEIEANSSLDQKDAASTVSDDTSTTPATTPEKIVLTQKELDDQAAKIKAIAERKAQRKYASYYQDEIDKYKSQHSNQNVNSTYQREAPPSPDHVWDELAGWIHKDTSREQYSNLITQALLNVQSTPNNQEKNSSVENIDPKIAYAKKMLATLSSEAADQFDECAVKFEDFQVGAAHFISPAMANAAAMAPAGMEMLYDLYKEDPVKLHKIFTSSEDKQKFMIWELQHNKNPQRNIVSKATPQPAPLDSNGTIKTSSEMSFEERKKRALKEDWGE